MQYAEIAVKTKTSLDRQTFTYQIKPEQLPYIKTGVLVLVPFHNRKIEGIILSLKHSNTKELKHKLKYIDKIIDVNPILTPNQIKLAKKIADYYIAPISEALFIMIPAVANRLAGKNLYSTKIDSGYDQTRKDTYTIYEREKYRIGKYLEITKKALLKQRGVILLFSKNDITEKYKKYMEILAGKYKIVIGSRQAIFSPVQNLSLIIIDQPEDFGYKDDQSPKYYSSTIAKFIHKEQGANLILGSNIARIEDYKNIVEKKYKVISDKSDQLVKNIKITIMNQNNEKGIISNYLGNQIAANCKKGKIFVYALKKGEGGCYACSDCGHIFACPRCNLPLYPNQKQLKCHRCSSKQTIPLMCPKCSGVKLRSYGVGAEKIKTKLSNLFPNLKINIIDTDNPLTDKIFIESDIIVGTKKIFEYNFNFVLSAAIGIDNQLNLPDYKSEENLLFDLYGLTAITESEFVIQTHFPENHILNNFRNLRDVLNKILVERKKYGYPPFSKIIKFVYKNSDEKKCAMETEKMSKKLIIILENSIEIIGTGACIMSKKGDKYYYQIIIKYLTKNDSEIKKALIGIKDLNNWIVDVDPIDLL